MPHVDIELEDNKQFISNIPRIIVMFVERFELYANSLDPDQPPYSAASDLGLHCLPLFHLWDARHKWVIFSTTAIILHS